MFKQAANLFRARRGAEGSADAHLVNGRPIRPPFPAHCERAMFAMGCFWGAERLFWRRPGVWVTAVGYAGGTVPDPGYRAVCSGRTGHAEAVLAVFEPDAVSYADLLRVFWEGHDPTQSNRQGNDVGTQYRSAIFVRDAAQRAAAELGMRRYGAALRRAGLGPIVTEIADWPAFYYAEEEHQQYLARNPGGYCGLGGTGVACDPPTAAVSG